ncbi:pilus assembly protein [Lysobacter sp. A286]
MKTFTPPTRRWASSALATFLVTLLALPVQAAIEIPTAPPMSGNGVPPNILFILDDSGSMEYRSMPFHTNSLDNSPKHRSSTNNTIYYNPAQVYQGWTKADGSRYPDTPPTDVYTHPSLLEAASSNNLNLGRDLTTDADLTDSEQTFYVLETDATNLVSYYSYTKYVLHSGGTAAKSCEWDGNDWDDCDVIGTFPWGRGIAQEWQNFANWYSYGRTRMKVAKAGASQAFAGVEGDDFRVGFATIWNGAKAGNTQLPIPVGTDNGLFRDTATTKNRSTWFSALLSAKGSGNTPLLPALDRAGKYFKDATDTGPYGGNLSSPDNKQFECRQNFSILTTDGYWNEKDSTPTGIGNADNSDGPLHTAPDPDPNDDIPSKSGQYEAKKPYLGDASITLADIAAYYWMNDLRTDMDNIVPVSAANPAFWQHMVTFGISIGLSGTVDQTSVAEVIANGGVTINGAAQSDWPDPTDTENAERIDDLLHAAVNGRGEFVAATSAEAFAQALTDALGSISDRVGSASNVSANSTSLSLNTRLYAGSYVGGAWSGELKALKVENMSAVNEPPIWAASEKMPTTVTSRDIFVYDGTAKEFKYSVLSTTLRAQLRTPLVSVGTDDGDNFADAAALAAARVEYIRGSKEFELTNQGPFRNRRRSGNHAPLGDIIHSSPFYLQNEVTGGTNSVFVGANDGMLHAFDADTGEELFGYIPAGTDWENLVSYSSTSYPHAYFVDGPVTVAPRAMASGRNILVGALGRGGKGLYALDVTDPSSFSSTDVKWDNSTQGDADPDMGHVLSRIFVANVNNGRPAVIFGNGVNSTNGHAVLYVVDLVTGVELAKIDTGVGGDNALSAPTGWDSDGNGTVDIVYAGDLKGNVWQFDLSSGTASDWDVSFSESGDPAPMFVATDSAGNRQAITGAVSVTSDPTTYTAWIVFGTGRLYNNDDLWNADGTANLAVNSIYGIRVPNAGPLGTRADIDGDADGLQVRHIELAGISQTDSQAIRGFELASALDDGKQGWVLDLLTPPIPGTAEGERVVGDAQVINGVFVFSSILPSSDPCLPGGRGFLNAINAFTGASVPAYFFDLDGDGAHTGADDIGGGGGDDDPEQRPVGSVDTGVGVPTNPTMMDKVVCVNGSSGTTECKAINNPATSGRISWRELIGG